MEQLLTAHFGMQVELEMLWAKPFLSVMSRKESLSTR